MAEEGIKVENVKDIAAAIGKAVASNLAKGDKNAKVLKKEGDRETAKQMDDFKDILLDIKKSPTKVKKLKVKLIKCFTAINPSGKIFTKKSAIAK